MSTFVWVVVSIVAYSILAFYFTSMMRNRNTERNQPKKKPPENKAGWLRIAVLLLVFWVGLGLCAWAALF